MVRTVRAAALTRSHTKALKEKREQQARPHGTFRGKFDIGDDLQDLIEDDPDPKERQLLEESVAFMYQYGETAEIDVNYLLRYLQTRQSHYQLCKRMPFTIAIFAVFINMVLWHEDLASAALMQRRVRNIVGSAAFEGVDVSSGHKTFYDITDTSEIYTFLEEAFLPVFLPADPEAVLNGREEMGKLHRVLRYSRLIGGVQLQQQRWGILPCEEKYPHAPEAQGIVRGLTCLADEGVDDCFGPLAFGVRRPDARSMMPSGFCGDKSSEGFGQLFYVGNESRRLDETRTLRPPITVKKRRLAEARRLRLSKSHQEARSVTRADPGVNPSIVKLASDTFSVLFTEEGGMPKAAEKLKWLQANEWMDFQTQWVGINVFMLNPELSMYTRASASFHIGSGAELVPHLKVQTFHAEPYQNMSIIAIDTAFLLLILYALFLTYAHFVAALYAASIVSHVKTLSHWVRWAVAHGGAGVAIMWVSGYMQLLTVKEKATDVALWLSTAIDVQLASATTAAPSSATNSSNKGWELRSLGDDQEYVRRLLDMHREVDDFTDFIAVYRNLLAAYGVLLLIGFFRLFQVQPKLAMFVNTILTAWRDVLHHAVVFCTFWTAFTLTGMVMFSRTVFAFGNFYGAYTTTFAMMLGNVNWDDISQENPTLAAVWLWLFTTVMTDLMLNMLVAIIMDVYTKVKGDAIDVEPIWTQVHTMVMDWLQDRDEIGPKALERILRRIASTQKIKKISAKLMIAIVPGMQKDQAVALVSGALRMQEVETGTNLTLSQMQMMIGRIQAQILRISHKTSILNAQMRQEQEENRLMAERRREDAERRADELNRLQSEERWEPSRRFSRRTKDIEETLEHAQRLMQDAMAWLAYRGKQVEGQVEKIEQLAREKSGREAASNQKRWWRREEVVQPPADLPTWQPPVARELPRAKSTPPASASGSPEKPSPSKRAPSKEAPAAPTLSVEMMRRSITESSASSSRQPPSSRPAAELSRPLEEPLEPAMPALLRQRLEEAERKGEEPEPPPPLLLQKTLEEPRPPMRLGGRAELERRVQRVDSDELLQRRERARPQAAESGRAEEFSF